jgi:hypothetical protein
MLRCNTPEEALVVYQQKVDERAAKLRPETRTLAAPERHRCTQLSLGLDQKENGVKYSIVALGGLLLGCSADVLDEGLAQSEGALEAPHEKQSEEDALNQDLQLIAESRGWTFEQAAAQHRAAEVVGRIGELLSETAPDSFIGTMLADVPGEAPTILLKGAVTPAVRSVVDSAPISITIADGHPFSLSELAKRKTKVGEALAVAGYRNFSTRAKLTERGVVRATVTIEPGLPGSADEIRSIIPEGVRDATTITFQEEPVGRDDTSFGGMLVGGGACTAGWSVVNELGVTGVGTAGHCGAMSTITHPPSTNHTLTFQFEHRGQYGDFEWHTTNVAEPAEFYAMDSVIRTVNTVEPYANMSIGEQVCLYSRVQGVRDCTLDINDLLVDCTVSGVYNNNLVGMNGDVAVGGDSGGGWSNNNNAFGFHKGSCGGGNVWTRASILPTTIAIAVLTQ